MDLCGKSSGFADFENTVDRGSAVILPRIPDCACLMFGHWVLNKIRITDLSSALINMSMSSSKLFLFSKEAHLNSGVRLLLELYCIVLIKHVAFFIIWAKSTAAFTCTSLPLNLYTLFSDVVVVLDLNKNFGGSADLHTPILLKVLITYKMLFYIT